MSPSVGSADAPDSAARDSRPAIETLESIRNAEWPVLDESMIGPSEIDVHGQERANGHARRAVYLSLPLCHPLEDERGVPERCNHAHPKRDGDVRADSQSR